MRLPHRADIRLVSLAWTVRLCHVGVGDTLGSMSGEADDDRPTRARSPTATGRGGDSGQSSATGEHADGFVKRHRRPLRALLLAAAVVGFYYYVLPQIVGLGPTLERLRSGNIWWLALGIPLEAVSIAALIALFHGVFGGAGSRIGWRASYQITMAGGGATKVFAAAGSGGVAITVWALRASGLTSEAVARGMVCFELLNYVVYMLALAVGGFGLWTGLFAGGGGVWLTLIPAVFGLAVIAAVLAMGWLATPSERFIVTRERKSHGRLQRFWRRIASVPRSLHEGLQCALKLVRSRDRSWLAAVPAWGFDAAVLWASFRAFGHSPPAAVVIMGYFVGTLGNALPVPAGIGGVEGGMIGAFLGFGVNGSLTVLAVLAYRTITYWLPLLFESISYVRLRHTVGEWEAHPQKIQSHPSSSTGLGPVRS